MRFRTLVVSLLIAGVGLAGLTGFRERARVDQAKREAAPVGQFLQVDGKAVHVLVQGSGPDLVLIHGANGNLRDFLPQLIGPLSRSYRVIAVDRPGLGWSDSLGTAGPSVAAQAAHLRKAVAQLGVTRPIVLGHSYGGAVALAWALQEPPAALVLVAAVSQPWPGTLDPWYRANETAVARAILPRLAAAYVPQSYAVASLDGVFAPSPPPKGYADQIGMSLILRASSLRENLAQVNALRPQTVEMQPRYSSLDLPVDLIHGDADTIVPLDVHSRPLSQMIPKAQLTVLAGAGHMPHHTHVPQILAAIDRAARKAGLRSP